MPPPRPSPLRSTPRRILCLYANISGSRSTWAALYVYSGGSNFRRVSGYRRGNRGNPFWSLRDRGPRDWGSSRGVWTRRAKGDKGLHESHCYGISLTLSERRGPCG